jgi:hypothetical protein
LGVAGVLAYALYQRSRPLTTGRFGRYGQGLGPPSQFPTKAEVAQRVAEIRQAKEIRAEKEAESTSDSVAAEATTTSGGVHGEGVDPRPGVYHGYHGYRGYRGWSY